jgi:hypothetical protein
MGPVNRIRLGVSAALIAATLAMQPVSAGAVGDPQHRRGRHEDRRDRDRAESREWRNDDYRNYEPGQQRYDAGRYSERRLGRSDRIYRGMDDRYYCQRDDGTTGLIVGGVAGGVLGNIIAPGGWKTVGTIIGAGAGSIIGREIDRGDMTCR